MPITLLHLTWMMFPNSVFEKPFFLASMAQMFVSLCVLFSSVQPRISKSPLVFRAQQTCSVWPTDRNPNAIDFDQIQRSNKPEITFRNFVSATALAAHGGKEFHTMDADCGQVLQCKINSRWIWARNMVLTLPFQVKLDRHIFWTLRWLTSSGETLC